MCLDDWRAFGLVTRPIRRYTASRPIRCRHCREARLSRLVLARDRAGGYSGFQSISGERHIRALKAPVRVRVLARQGVATRKLGRVSRWSRQSSFTPLWLYRARADRDLPCCRWQDPHVTPRPLSDQVRTLVLPISTIKMHGGPDSSVISLGNASLPPPPSIVGPWGVGPAVPPLRRTARPPYQPGRRPASLDQNSRLAS